MDVLPQLRRAASPFVLCTGRSGRREVALTFDDGPDPETTPGVLAALGPARATFFALGAQVRQWPEVARMVAEAGHEVACHGDNHERLTRMSAEATRADIWQSRDTIAEATGVPPTYYRPPHGLFNVTAWREAGRLGMRRTLWSVSGRDWETGATSDQVTARVLSQVRPGAIVLLHDAGGSSGRARVTIAALPGILAGLADLNLEPVTLSHLTDDDRRPVHA